LYYQQQPKQEAEFRLEPDAIVACCGENCAACSKYEQKTCDGCQAAAGNPDAKLSDYCAYQCGVRPCCQGKKLKNCAYCEEYGCQKLRDTWAFGGFKKQRLDYIRKSL